MKGRFSPGYAAWLRLPYCSDNGIAITIRRVNPNNPLRNVRMIMPGLVGVKFKASRYVRCTWRDMNLYWINMWCLLQPWQWLAISPLRILRDSWSWAFSSMVSDAFQVDLELRTSTLKGFFVLQEFEENRGHQKHWHKLKLDLFVCVNVQWKFVLWKLWGKIWSASQQFVWWIGLISIRCLGNEGKSQWSQDARMANIGY